LPGGGGGGRPPPPRQACQTPQPDAADQLTVSVPIIPPWAWPGTEQM
jgi:hypothetical protein